MVTALVPSETACLASSPGRRSRTAVWISREEVVGLVLYLAILDDRRLCEIPTGQSSRSPATLLSRAVCVLPPHTHTHAAP